MFPNFHHTLVSYIHSLDKILRLIQSLGGVIFEIYTFAPVKVKNYIFAPKIEKLPIDIFFIPYTHTILQFVKFDLNSLKISNFVRGWQNYDFAPTLQKSPELNFFTSYH